MNIYIFLGRRVLFMLLAVLVVSSGFVTASVAHADSSINIWWPTNGASMHGVQPFKAMVNDLDISQYSMYWQVDGGQLNQMDTNTSDYPHKESSVDLSGWNWHGNGPYTITFVAKDQSGNQIGSQSVQITLDNQPAPQPTPPQPQPVPEPAPQPAPITPTTPTPLPSYAIEVWWPTNASTVSGVQPLKAMIPGLDVSQYTLSWNVNGDGSHSMDNNSTDYPHKETSIDFTNWTWAGSGPYTINLIATNAQGVIAKTALTLYTPTASTQPQQTKTIVSTPPPAPVVNSTNPLAGLQLYVNASSSAAVQLTTLKKDSSNAQEIAKIANSPQAQWFGDWDTNIGTDVAAYIKNAKAVNQTPVLVLYNIPNRDCGGYSNGGAATPTAYTTWITAAAKAIGSSKAVVILEPDSLAQMDCLSSTEQQTRLSLLTQAGQILKKNSGAIVYQDAGNPNWQSVSTMSSRLAEAGIKNIDGFALNVSNYVDTPNNLTYGDQLSSQLGGTHFVVDTSRNGLGSNGEWCNASGRALGPQPTTSTGDSHADAFLWIKTPGESDGTCNGGPNAGVWWLSYALGLAERAAY